AKNRLPYVLFLNGLFDKRESNFVRTCRNPYARRSHALIEFSPRYDDVLSLRLVVFFAADRHGKHLIAIHSDDKLMRRVLALDADITFGNRVQQSSVKHILAVCRKHVVYKDAASRADGQSFHVMALRNDSAYRVCRGARLG